MVVIFEALVSVAVISAVVLVSAAVAVASAQASDNPDTQPAHTPHSSWSYNHS